MPIFWWKVLSLASYLHIFIMWLLVIESATIILYLYSVGQFKPFLFTTLALCIFIKIASYPYFQNENETPAPVPSPIKKLLFQYSHSFLDKLPEWTHFKMTTAVQETLPMNRTLSSSKSREIGAMNVDQVAIEGGLIENATIRSCIRSSTLKKTFHCHLCETSYEWPSDLRRHIKIKHNSTFRIDTNSPPLKKTFHCHLCETSYEWPSDLRRHIKIKHNNTFRIDTNSPPLKKAFHCHLCDTSYKWPSDLTRHMRIKHTHKHSHTDMNGKHDKSTNTNIN